MKVYTWESYTLTLEYAGMGQYGKSKVAYSLTKEGESVPIFEGADLEGHFDAEGPKAAAALLGFLTLQEGDTDKEYFDGYTERQREFSECEAEDLREWGYSLQCPQCGTVEPDQSEWESVDWINDPPAWSLGQDPDRCDWCGSLLKGVD